MLQSTEQQTPNFPEGDHQKSNSDPNPLGDISEMKITKENLKYFNKYDPNVHVIYLPKYFDEALNNLNIATVVYPQIFYIISLNV